MVMVGDGVHVIQCLEGDPIVLEIPYSEIKEVKITEDYESENLLSSGPDSDNGVVRHLRTPRLAMSLVTKDQNLILIAHAGQVDFVSSYLQVRTSRGESPRIKRLFSTHETLLQPVHGFTHFVLNRVQ